MKIRIDFGLFQNSQPLGFLLLDPTADLGDEESYRLVQTDDANALFQTETEGRKVGMDTYLFTRRSDDTYGGLFYALFYVLSIYFQSGPSVLLFLRLYTYLISIRNHEV